MKISEIQANQGRIEIEAIVSEISAIKEFSKFGKIGKVCTATLEDGSGKIQLTLWDEQTELLKKGDKIKITNGYVKEWQGEKQLNTGKYGSIEIKI